MIKVSVIVPVYNGESYLDNCIAQLLGQTLEDIEIILVDDMSTDNSLNIMKQWQGKHPDKIKVLQLSKKGGPGGARNYGISMACGEYIGFVDCDDVFDETMYEKLYIKALEDDYDIVDCGYYSEANNRSVLTFTRDVCGDTNSENIARLIIGAGYIVTKVFKRQLLEGILFRESRIYEDLDFMAYTLLRAKRIACVEEVLYIYKYNPSSASNYKNEQKKFDDLIDAKRVIEKLMMPASMKEAKEYIILTNLGCAIGICLANQDNREFALNKNLAIVKKEWRPWFKSFSANRYVHTHMDAAIKDILVWYNGLMK